MLASPTRLSAALAVLLTLGLPVHAQDATTGDAATETPADEAPDDAGTDTPDAEAGGESDAPATGQTGAPAAPTAPGGDLATGQGVGEALGGGPEIYVREEHGDWEVRCLEAPEGQEDPCQLYQRLADQQGNPTADVNVFDVPDGNGEIVAGATVLTPLQTLLTAQVTMTIDGNQPRRYPFSFCDSTGCYSRMGFTAQDVAALKRGATATLVVVPAMAPDQRAEMKMSLSGFTAGLAAVEVANPE